MSLSIGTARSLVRPFFFSSFFHLDTRSKSKHSPPHLLISIPLKNKKILWCLLLLLQYANKLLSRVRKGNFGVKLFQRGKTLESKSESVGYFIGADRELDTYAKKKEEWKITKSQPTKYFNIKDSPIFSLSTDTHMDVKFPHFFSLFFPLAENSSHISTWFTSVPSERVRLFTCRVEIDR